jgi:hypothetical protein
MDILFGFIYLFFCAGIIGMVLTAVGFFNEPSGDDEE